MGCIAAGTKGLRRIDTAAHSQDNPLKCQGNGAAAFSRFLYSGHQSVFSTRISVGDRRGRSESGHSALAYRNSYSVTRCSQCVCLFCLPIRSRVTAEHLWAFSVWPCFADRPAPALVPVCPGPLSAPSSACGHSDSPPRRLLRSTSAPCV